MHVFCQVLSGMAFDRVCDRGMLKNLQFLVLDTCFIKLVTSYRAHASRISGMPLSLSLLNSSEDFVSHLCKRPSGPAKPGLPRIGGLAEARHRALQQMVSKNSVRCGAKESTSEGQWWHDFVAHLLVFLGVV